MGVQYDPPAGVIERWQPELDRIAPRTEQGYSWLKLVWEPGEEWCPVGRWIVYEMHPPNRLPAIGILEDLEGPNPREFGHYDYAAKRFRRTRVSTITQRQWQLYQETGYYGRPMWIVQGKNGGHKRWWTDIEQHLAMMKLDLDEPVDPPAPGDLEYAEPDMLTISKLYGLDRVRMYGELLSKVSHDQGLRDSLDILERETARKVGEALWDWVGDQMDEALTFTRAQEQYVYEGTTSPDGEHIDYDREHDEFMDGIAEEFS